MSHPLLRDCLQALSRARTNEAKRHVFQTYRRDLLRHPEIGAELAAIAGSARKEEEAAAQLDVLELLIGEARMDRENAGPYGPAFLSALEDAIERSAGDDALSETGTRLLARAYVRAGLAVPGCLRRSPAAMSGSPVAFSEPPDFDALLDRLTEEAEGNAYALHAALSELLATVDPQVQAMLMGAMLERDNLTFARLGCYWLLDSSAETRSAAAVAFARRAGAGRLDAATTSRLIELRNWLPEDAARETLDQGLTAARERDISGGMAPRPWTLHRVVATIPDGAGAQSMAIAAQRGGERGVAMLLLKQGFGVKDAYVIPCRSATEQRRVMAQVAEEAEAQDVTPAMLAPALAAALAEGQELGMPPAHGLIDVVEILGLYDLRPEAMAVEDWVAQLDPEGELSRLSPQKLGRLVNASGDWPKHYPLVESWYEDSAAVQEILMDAITPRTRELHIWCHLESRRDWWARIMAKAAATLKATAKHPDEAWTSFAATALALARGRPLRKVPVMDWIVERSFEAAEDPRAELRHARDDAPLSTLEDTETPVTFTPPAPEKRGELARLMQKVGMAVAPDWIDGYLAAIVVAPKVAPPSKWVSGLLEQKHSFADHDELQRFLDLVMHRYNAANTDLADATATSAKIRALDGQGLRNWAEGFTASVTRLKGHWRSKTVTDDDRRVLKLIADAAKGRAGASELKPLLPAWLARRHAQRR